MKKRKVILGFLLAAGAVAATPTLTSCEFGNHEVIAQEFTVTFDVNGGSEVAAQTVKDGEKATKPADPTKNGKVFAGWYGDANYAAEFSFDTEIKADTTVYAKWTEAQYEEVSYSVVAQDLDTGALSDKIVGPFTLKGEIRGRTKNWTNPENAEEKLDWTKSIKNGPIVVKAPGNGKLVMYLQNGSSGAASQFVQITAEGEEPTKIEFSGATTAIAPYGSGSPVVRIEVEVAEGKTYTIERGNGGTIDWYQLDLTCTVEKSELVGFQVTGKGTTDFIEGTAYDASGITLQKVYGNGRTEVLDVNDADVTVDTSAYNAAVGGTYDIVIKYKDYEAQKVSVNVWTVDSLKLGFNADYKGANSKANNGCYINGKVKTIYAANEALDTKYLTTIASCKLGEATKDFIVTGASIAAVDTATSGAKTVSVSYEANGKTKTAEYNITVVDATPVQINGQYVVTVDQAFTGVAGTASDTLGNQFKTIGEAIEFLSREGIDAEKTKVLNIAAGTYTEKLEIAIPNLTIKGAGAANTIIEWDSLYGCKDESGYTQVTDSTQTVAVRDTAVNCTIENLTISNWWNSEERFQSKLDYLKAVGLATDTKINEHRALALLVQSDQFTLNGCKLLGYQDTVEFFQGRQYIVDSYIAGTTDYIFGTNNTTLFENCEIHTIYNGSTAGGYTTAFKGMNKDANDAVTYGAVFHGCKFTADEQITEANSALGRPWGAYAAVAYIECEFGAHISKVASTGASQNERYVAMSGVLPTAETVKYMEYNNTGAGAITEEQAGMHMIAAADVANYYTFATVFGTTNGGVTYEAAWNPLVAMGTPVISKNESTVTWAAVEGATGYQVYVNDVAEGAVQTTTSYTFNKEAVGNYVVKVVAIANTRVYTANTTSNEVTFTVANKEAVALAAPTGVTANGAVVSWTAVEGAQGYLVFVDDAAEGIAVTEASATITGAGVHSVTVVAKGDTVTTKNSEKSTAISVTVTEKVAAPVVVQGTATATNVKKTGTETVLGTLTNNNIISWGAVANAVSYTVYASTDETFEDADIVANATTALSYTFENVATTQKYNVKVVANVASDDTIHLANEATIEYTADSTVSYVLDNSDTIKTGYVYKFTDETVYQSGSSAFAFGGLTINGSAGKFAFSSENKRTQFNSGATISLHVAANSTITVNNAKFALVNKDAADEYTRYYNAYTINNIEPQHTGDADTHTYFFAEEQDVVIKAITTKQISTDTAKDAGSNVTTYLNGIVVKTNQQAPVAANVTAIEISGGKRAFGTGDDFDYSTLVVKGYLDDGTIVILPASEYEVTNDITDNTVAGEYTVTVKSTANESLTKTYKVNYSTVTAQNLCVSLQINPSSDKNYAVGSSDSPKTYENTFTLSADSYKFVEKRASSHAYVSVYHGVSLSFTVTKDHTNFAIGVNSTTALRYVVLTKGGTQVNKKYFNTTDCLGSKDLVVNGLTYSTNNNWLIFSDLTAGDYVVTFDSDEASSSAKYASAEDFATAKTEKGKLYTDSCLTKEATTWKDANTNYYFSGSSHNGVNGKAEIKIEFLALYPTPTE